jgi:hypothetical protein
MEGNQAGNGVANPNQWSDCTPDAKGSGDSTPSNARFLVLATKQTNSKTSSYLFSCENGSQNTIDDRGSEYVLGKLKGNAIGSQYLIVDNGRSPEKTTGPSMTRKEYGVVRFEFDSGGPGVVEAWVPSVNSSGSTCAHWQPNSSEKSMSTIIENFVESVSAGTSNTRSNNDSKSSGSFSPTPESDQYSKLFMLKNKKPKWDDAHGGHVLNFQVCAQSPSPSLRSTTFRVPFPVLLYFLSAHVFSNGCITYVALLCFALLCFALLCFALLCFALLCFALLWWLF